MPGKGQEKGVLVHCSFKDILKGISALLKSFPVKDSDLLIHLHRQNRKKYTVLNNFNRKACL